MPWVAEAIALELGQQPLHLTGSEAPLRGMALRSGSVASQVRGRYTTDRVVDAPSWRDL